ncbi:MAG: S53 family peptidase, partial [Candidatus Dormibacteraeota bacterium]|nr:S53 family peptidase [Candidatus Dormibacteraeota bacterium]
MHGRKAAGRTAVALGAVSVAAASVFAGGAPALATVKPIPAVTGHVMVNDRSRQAPTSAECLAQFDIACYSPQQIEDHYHLPTLYKQGLTGKGKTIIIVDSFGSPTIASDLQTFDAEFGLPNPALSIIQPAGAVPPFDPTNSDMVGWAEETTLDVEWSHSIAPGANILLVETPVSETEGVVGFPQIVEAENYVINHHLGDVISQSFGATEETFPSADSLFDLRSAYKNAHAHNVTVLAASGDNGVTDNYDDLSCCYPYPVTSWPDSDTLVTAVGGTEVVPESSGNPEGVSHDVVWHDLNKNIGGSPTDPTTCCAGGGGLSVVFSRPDYQNSVAGRVGKSRGVPDISMSASVKGAVLVYSSFQPFGPS